MVDADVAFVADDQGLSLAGGHHHLPTGGWVLAPSLAPDVLQVPDVVDLDSVPRAAKLAGVGKEALEKVCSDVPDPIWLVVKDCI